MVLINIILFKIREQSRVLSTRPTAAGKKKAY